MSLQETLTAFAAELAAAQTPDDVQELRVKYLGKKSYVKTALKTLGSLPAEERVNAAKEINAAQADFETQLTAAAERIANAAIEKQIAAEWQDLTMPGIAQQRGATHPLTQVHKKAMDVMRRLGFRLEEGPDIELPYYNFDA
ncbi:MAG: phenylalanine--tRNA ligase subunit alpha, partial [Thermoanaerobaculia bacterium]